MAQMYYDQDADLSLIQRDTVLTLARDARLPVAEERLVRDRLYDADEVFLCGTAAEIVGVCEVDFRPVGAGSVKPITREMQLAFRQVVRGEHPRSAEWLEPVGAPRHIGQQQES